MVEHFKFDVNVICGVALLKSVFVVWNGMSVPFLPFSRKIIPWFKGIFTFTVSDRGVGAFESVRKKFKMKNSFEAAEHLLKGKQTTAPERHSGQGIFFTSRIADHFALERFETAGAVTIKDDRQAALIRPGP